MLHHKIAQRSQNRQKKTEKKILKQLRKEKCAGISFTAWCPLFATIYFPPVITLARKDQRNPSVTVHIRKDNHLSPSLDENAKESFDLAFELAFHSILLYPAGPLHILTRYSKRIFQTSIYFKISTLWMVEDSFVFFSRCFQSRNISKQLKQESKLAFLAVLFS